MGVQVSDAAVQVNNNTIAIIPNTLEYDEGLGEQEVRNASAGGGQTEQIYSHNVETNFSMCKFSIPSTVENIALARSWKANRNLNVVSLAGRTPEGNVTRTFTQASLPNNYVVPLTSDGNIELEFKSNPAI